MVRRTARRGDFAGRDFFGCAAFGRTNCPGKVDIGAVAQAGAPPPAGASVQAVFEARREREKARRRALLPAVVACALIAMVMEFLLIWPLNSIIASVVIVITGFAFVKVVTELPNDVIRWERGAQGERATAGYLTALEAAGFISFHNRWVAGLRGDVDHIAVGPTGIFVIETKTTTAKVEVIRDSLLLAEHDKQEWVDQVTREAMAVQIALRDLVDPLHRTVAPVLCVHGSGPGIGRTVAGVQIVSGPRLAATLSAAPSVLTDMDIQRLAEAIDVRLSRQPR
jgi:Nuclease-related domain